VVEVEVCILKMGKNWKIDDWKKLRRFWKLKFLYE
jgi:hypothetical protein